MKRYKVNVHTKGCNFEFEIDIPEGTNRFYNTDNTSMEFYATDGRVFIFPRLETSVVLKPLIPETIWKEK